jgi:hypothetical protein
MKRFFVLLDLIIIAIIFVLPYLLFKGKLYISGDDTRLLYVYPWEYIRNIAFFSWHNISSVGSNAPNQFLLPILYILTFFSKFLSRIQLDYFSFSLPLVISFIYWKRFLGVIVNNKEKYKVEILLGSLFFISSPILIVNQLFIFLSTIWLLPVVPSLSYYFVKFIKEGKYSNIIKAFFICFIFSAGFFSIPWVLGIMVPIIFSLILFSGFFPNKQKKNFLIKSFIYFIAIVFSQMFWFLPFVSTYFNSGSSNFGSQVLSKAVADTFSPTVLSTATGTILYPLLNIFHRQIAFDFVWHLKDTFINYYDKTLYINLIFPFVLIFGLYNFKKYFKNHFRYIYLIFLTSFVFSLYLFTVNIGPLKDLFLIFGHVPGFVMFRNFYDKFALGYVYFYTIVLTFSLIILKQKIKDKNKINIFYFIFLLAIVINFIPVGQVINAPLWTTKDVYRNINIPSEYTNFMEKIKKDVNPTSTILTIPFGEALYSVIKDESSNSVYTGTSPVRILSDVNDISGYLSFNFSDAQTIISTDIEKRDYDNLNKFLYSYNVNYLLRTKNIPENVLNSWIYNRKLVDLQDDRFIESLTSKRIAVSSNGNYELYLLKNRNTLIDSKNITYKKINPITYRIYIKNLNAKQDLIFNDSFHDGWKIILEKNPSLDNCITVFKKNSVTECKYEENLITGQEINYFLEKDIFKNTHTVLNNFSNKWIIDKDQIKNNYSSNYYKINKNGSLDVELILYFVPQTYFYLGCLLTFGFLIILLLLIYEKEYKKNNK